jgi:hypothetical protein
MSNVIEPADYSARSRLPEAPDLYKLPPTLGGHSSMAGSPGSDGMGSRLYALLGALLAAGTFLASGAAAQAPNPCTPPSGDTGFAEIGVNLNAGTFDRILPFDVPIRLCGTVPAGSTDVTVQYAVSKTANLSVDADCRLLAPAGAQWLPAAPIAGRLDGTTFRVILPPLDADRYYSFCFRRRAQIPPDVAAAFRPKAREVLDQELAQVITGDLSAEQSLKLRTDLYHRLLEAAGADVAVVKGTVFDTTPGYDELRGTGKFHSLVQGVLDPQRRRDRIVEGAARTGIPPLSEQQESLHQTLKMVADNPALPRLLAQIEEAAQTQPGVRQMLASRDLTAAMAMVRADDEHLFLTAFGRAAGAPPPNLEDPDQAASLAASYAASSQALTALSGLARKAIAAPPAIPLETPVSPNDARALHALIDPATGALPRAANLAFALSGLAENLQTALIERSAALDQLADKVRIEAAGVGVVDGSTTGNFATSQTNYISADAGLVFAPELKTGVTYVGMNFYWRPVNKDANLSQLGNFRQTFTRRFSNTLGLTVQSLADGGSGTAQTRKDLFGSQSLILGAGVRITNSFRFSGGAVVFRKRDRNPLVSSYSLTTTYYLSLSFDLNVAKAFQGGLGGLF